MAMPSVKKNYLLNLAYQVLALLTPFITAPYVSRILGADGIGIYSYTSSLMTYFTMFALLGVTNYGMREIARHRDDPQLSSKLFWEIELMVCISTAICLIVWGGVVYFYEEYRWYLLALTPQLITCALDVSWFFLGHEQMGKVVLRNTIVKILCIILLFTCIHEKEDLLLYIILNVAAGLFGSLWMCASLPKLLVKVDPRTFQIGHHFKETLVYFIPTIATSIYTVLDKTLIGIITADVYANGYYEQATKIINMGKTLTFTSVNLVMGARISYLYAQEKFDEIHARIQKSMDFVLIVGFGLAFGIAGVAENFVPLFFGQGFEPVIPMLCAMCPLIVIIGVSNTLASQYYMPCGRQKDSTKFVIVGAVCNLCCNLIFIPLFAAMGAIIGSLIAELLVTFLFVHFCNRQILWKDLAKLSWKKVMAGILMFAITFSLGHFLVLNNILLLLIQVLAAVVVYAGLLLLARDKMAFELVGLIKSLGAKIQNRLLH